MPDINELKAVARGAANPEEAEKRIIAKFGGLPDVLLNPIDRAEILKGAGATPATTAIDAHLSNFEQAYSPTLGDDAKRVGYERNIAGQGLPGTEDWVGQQRTGKAPVTKAPSRKKG